MWYGWSSVVWLTSVHSSSVPRTGAAIGISVGWNCVSLMSVANGSLPGLYWKRNVRLCAALTCACEKSSRGTSRLGSGASGTVREDASTCAVASVWSTGTLVPLTTSTGSGFGTKEGGGPALST